MHVAGLPFVGVQHDGWGAYVAPEFGQGGAYTSTLLSGGVSRDLIWAHLFRLTAMVGYASYAEAPSDPTRALRGPSFGGMASVPLLGPVRLAYRGQHVRGPSGSQVTRYSVGFLLF